MILNFTPKLLFLIKIIISFIGNIILICLLFYTQTTIYVFPEEKAFSGDKLYNPYQKTNFTKSLKANFHAHAKSWKGMTNGDDNSEAVSRSYQAKKYGMAAVSNYFSFDNSNHQTQVYEHGINLKKSHKLAIHPKKIDFFDYPFTQNTSQKQDIINRLVENEALVVLAHPNFCSGHTLADMQQLVGYNFIELRSYYANAEKEWDTALSSGKLAWLMCNDDTHGLKKQPPQRFFSEVFTADSDSILGKMNKGEHYGIALKEGLNNLNINYLKIQNKEKIHFDFGNSAKEVKVIIDGVLSKSFRNGMGIIQFPENGHYMRFVVESDNATLYTNPIVKTQSEFPILAANQKVTTNEIATFFVRAFYWLLVFLVSFLNFSVWSKPIKLRIYNRKTLVPN